MGSYSYASGAWGDQLTNFYTYLGIFNIPEFRRGLDKRRSSGI